MPGDGDTRVAVKHLEWPIYMATSRDVMSSRWGSTHVANAGSSKRQACMAASGSNVSKVLSGHGGDWEGKVLMENDCRRPWESYKAWMSC